MADIAKTEQTGSIAQTARSWMKNIFQIEQAGLFVAFVILCIIISLLTPVFLSVVNIMNVLRQASLIAITGIGMALIILVGEIDLSVGSAQAVVGIITVWILNQTGNVPLSIAAALGTGAFIGIVNGFLVTKGKINSLIATLAMMAIWRGLAMISTQAVSIQAKVDSFQNIGTGFWGPFPIPVVLTILLFCGFFYILNYTSFGRYVYAVGGNANAAGLSGLPVNRIKFLTYVIGGVLTALSGLILASRMNSGQPNAGIGFEMQVIAAVILGGISLSGGVGTLAGAFIGIIILSVLSNGLILLNVSSFYHDVARGLVILLAVYMDSRRKQGLTKRLLKN